VLAWLSVWTEVQTCIWPSWCHCHSLSLASVKSRLVLPFWYWLTQVVPEKGPLNGCVCKRWYHSSCGGISSSQYSKICRDSLSIKCVVRCVQQILIMTDTNKDSTSTTTSIIESAKRRILETNAGKGSKESSGFINSRHHRNPLQSLGTTETRNVATATATGFSTVWVA